MPATIHLHPTAELAPRVLLPGDPGRALLLAQTLLEAPLMFNHNRGLWGYTGAAPDGEPLTIQSTGMGAPSAAIVVSELIDLGAERIVRTGTCGALSGALALGDLVVVESALSADGVSAALGPAAPDPGLTAALPGEHRGGAVTSDLFYDPDLERQERWATDGALVVEMECAAVFAVAALRGVAAAALLLVTDLVLPARERIDPDALREGEERLGRAALAAV
ncbi:MAG: purine-nucleoside phosphorylase [Solirubrobacteraceae bacterium]